MKINDSVIVITGGVKGLGKEMATILKNKGGKVVVIDKDPVADFVVDVTDEAKISEVASQIESKFGPIDIWINNAGVWMPPQSLEEVDMTKAKNLFQINVFGYINGMRAAIRQMKPRQSGTILNIISTTAFDGLDSSSGSMYISSKYALRGLNNAVRQELQDSNIQVLAVYPGGMKTDLFHGFEPKNIDDFMSPTEIAQKIVDNLELSSPELDLVLKRPGQKIINESIKI